MALVFSAIHAENTSIHTPVAPRSFRVRFWQHWAGTVFNGRQVKLLNRLPDHNLLRDHLLDSPVIHMDETTVQVLKLRCTVNRRQLL